MTKSQAKWAARQIQYELDAVGIIAALIFIKDCAAIFTTKSHQWAVVVEISMIRQSTWHKILDEWIQTKKYGDYGPVEVKKTNLIQRR